MSEASDPPILLVDDNLLSSAGLVTGLTRLDLRVEAVDVAAQVLARARETRPRAVLINLAARSLASVDRVRELKHEPGLASVPVVGYCGHLETELIGAGREAGCDLVVANSAIAADLPAVLRRAGIPFLEEAR